MKRFLCFLLALLMLALPVTGLAEETAEESIPESYTVLKAMRAYYENMYQFGITDKELLDALLLAILKEKDDSESFEFLADALASALDDHSVYFTPEELDSFNEYVDGAFGGIGVSMMNVDGYCTVAEVLENTPASKVDISTGDKIIAVNGESVVNCDVDLVVSKVRGEVGTDVTLTLKAGNRVWDVVITRQIVSVKSVDYVTNDNGDTAYMVIARFGGETSNEFIKNYNEIKAKGINKIIIDLRDNTGGYTNQAEQIASVFLPEGAVIFSEKSRAYNLQIPFVSKNKNPDTETELVLLVNEYTASSSEILTGALKENNRATVVGTNTFGKGTVQTVTSLGEYGSIKTTIAEFVSPLGNTINKVGVKPDYIVENEVRRVQESDLKPLSFKVKYRVGDEGEEVLAIKQRLGMLGYYSGDRKSPVFDKELELAVTKFQEDKELYPYGVADLNTQLTIHTHVMVGDLLVDKQLDKAFEILGTTLENK